MFLSIFFRATCLSVTFCSPPLAMLLPLPPPPPSITPKSFLTPLHSHYLFFYLFPPVPCMHVSHLSAPQLSPSLSDYLSCGFSCPPFASISYPFPPSSCSPPSPMFLSLFRLLIAFLSPSLKLLFSFVFLFSAGLYFLSVTSSFVIYTPVACIPVTSEPVNRVPVTISVVLLFCAALCSLSVTSSFVIFTPLLVLLSPFSLSIACLSASHSIPILRPSSFSPDQPWSRHPLSPSLRHGLEFSRNKYLIQCWCEMEIGLCTGSRV